MHPRSPLEGTGRNRNYSRWHVLPSSPFTEYPEPRHSSGSAFELSTNPTHRLSLDNQQNPIQAIQCLEEPQTLVDERDHAFHVLASGMDACPVIPWW